MSTTTLDRGNSDEVQQPDAGDHEILVNLNIKGGVGTFWKQIVDT